MSRRATALLMTVLVAASAVPAAAAAPTSGVQASTAQDGSAYAGAHVSFDVEGNAIADYAVGGDTALQRVKVQSESETDGTVGVGLELSAVTDIDGSALSLSSQTTASAEVAAEGSASMTAHDNGHGILVVDAGGSDQVVVANVSSSAQAEAESDSQVEVTTSDGTEGTFVVVGNGSVAVNDDGDVSASLGDDAKLVFRAYPEGQSEQDERTEEAIASGTVTGEAYVEQQDGELVTDTVTYGAETTIEAEQSAENAVSVTVDRARSEGKVVVTQVSEAAVGSVSDLSVTVDGEAAAQASSYSELKGAIGGDTSKYMVEQSSSASATADVYVAVNHFSERTITMQGDGGSDGTTTSDESTTSSDATTSESTTAADTTESDGGGNGDGGDGGGESGGGVPGFGVTAALAALAGVSLYALRE